MRHMLLAAAGVFVVTSTIACTSPEAGRSRGGGPGADPGNRGAVVQMHEGSEPYFETPRLVESPGKSGGAAGPRTAERGNP